MKIEKLTEKKALNLKFQIKISVLLKDVDNICQWLWEKDRCSNLSTAELALLKNALFGVCSKLQELADVLTDNSLCKKSVCEMTTMMSEVNKIKDRILSDTCDLIIGNCLKEAYGGFYALRSELSDADLAVRNLIKRECAEFTSDTIFRDDLEDKKHHKHDDIER